MFSTNFQQIFIIPNASIQFRSILFCLITTNHPQASNYSSNQGGFCVTTKCDVWWFHDVPSPISLCQCFWLTPIGIAGMKAFLQIPQTRKNFHHEHCAMHVAFFNRGEKNQFLLLTEICSASRLSNSIFCPCTKAKAEIYSDLIDFLATTRARAPFIPLLSAMMIYALYFRRQVFPGSIVTCVCNVRLRAALTIFIVRSRGCS